MVIKVIPKVLPYILLVSCCIFTLSCTHDVKFDGSLNYSSVGDLEFSDIDNIKEYEACINDTNNFIDPDPDLRVISFSKMLDGYLFLASFGNIKVKDHSKAISFEQINNVANTGENGSIAISDAVRLGSIGKIKFVDYKYKRTGLFQTQMCVILYGE